MAQVRSVLRAYWRRDTGGADTAPVCQSSRRPVSILETGLSWKRAYPGNGPTLETGLLWKRAYLGNGLSRGTGLPEETCFKKEKPTSKNLFGVGLFLLCWSSVESVLFVLCRTFRTFYVRLRCMLSGHEVDGGVESGIVRVVSYYYTCIF